MNKEKIEALLYKIAECFEFYYYDNGNVKCKSEYHLKHIELFNELLMELLNKNILLTKETLLKAVKEINDLL